ncbi:MAG: ROK family glucokinase [Ruminococcaceae bacterium]|nr:ROK family glucokinase [Oscillospiraceae bacterium]
MSSYAIGVDIGGTSVKLGLFSNEGTLLEKWEIPTDTQEQGERILPDIVRSIRQTLIDKQISFDRIAGIGMGVPGPVDETGVVRKCVNLGWGVFNIKDRMTQLLPEIPTIAAGNDANVATLGELWQGGGKGHDSAVMFTLGTGVGGGVVLKGTVVPGFNGAAGEVGHITVEPLETEPCSCGKRGCLEQYASANGIVRLAKHMLAQCDTPSRLRALDRITAKDICDLARDGESMSAAILDRCADYLALAMSYVSCTVDPQIFLVGGGMSRAGSVLINAIAAHYRKYAFHACAQTPISEAKLGNDAGIFGCAALILT